MSMQKGFNTDIQFQGLSYHVQTEDWGAQNPYLVSRVFNSGAVIKSLKIPYRSVLPDAGKANAESVRLAMKVQHQKILDLLVSGQLL